MSDLQRSFAKAKLAGLPPILPDDFAEEEERDDLKEFPIEHPDDDSSSASSASSTGTIKPTISKNLFARPNGTPTKNSLSQIPWTTYFERTLRLPIRHPTYTITHHVYLTSPTGSSPLFVTHHGAGSSGLSFALLASQIRKLLPGAGILSLDARGHGETVITLHADPNHSQDSSSNSTSPETPPQELELSLPTLTNDLLSVITSTTASQSWPTIPPLILIGHSLGGAVVTSLAHSGALSAHILGYCVLDVVEGSAIDALTSMQTYLSTRPQDFTSLQQGIEWHVRSRTIRNSVSARTSVPALLKLEGGNQETGQRGEGGETEGETRKGRWTWRTDLAATQPFWEGWFVGLSKKFLEAKGGKMLLLAGTDRLDKELMIGQMQGKYALQVFPGAGHFIHEDLPEKTAIAVVDFYKRNDRSALVLPPKVGDMLKAGRKI